MKRLGFYTLVTMLIITSLYSIKNLADNYKTIVVAGDTSVTQKNVIDELQNKHYQDALNSVIDRDLIYQEANSLSLSNPEVSDLNFIEEIVFNDPEAISMSQEEFQSFVYESYLIAEIAKVHTISYEKLNDFVYSFIEDLDESFIEEPYLVKVFEGEKSLIEKIEEKYKTNYELNEIEELFSIEFDERTLSYFNEYYIDFQELEEKELITSSRMMTFDDLEELEDLKHHEHHEHHEHYEHHDIFAAVILIDARKKAVLTEQSLNFLKNEFLKLNLQTEKDDVITFLRKKYQVKFQ